MPASKIRVVPPFDVRGLYVLSFLLGALSAPIGSRAESFGFRLAESQWFQDHLGGVWAYAMAISITIGGALLPAMLIGAWLSCVSQRRAQTAGAAAVSGAAQLLAGLFIDKVLFSSDGGTDWEGWPPLGFLLNVAILALLSAGAALCIRWVTRTFFFRTTEEESALCHRCGYSLGSPAITTCPECGTPVEPLRRSFARLSRVAEWLQRRARFLVLLILIAITVRLAIVVPYRSVPALRFYRSFPRNDIYVMGSMTPHTFAGGLMPHCLGAWVPITPDKSRGIVVLYIPDRRSELPAMRLAYAGTPGSSPASSGSQPDFGAPQVACDLSRELAERVVREGIPPALIEQLKNRAELAGWARNGSLSFTPIPQTYWIDPEPCFTP